MNQYINLAKFSISHYLKTGEVPEIPRDLPDEIIARRAGVFVCFKRNGELRGCIGTFTPVYENIAQEIIQNTISAATQDPRFLPVSLSELDEITVAIDILSEPEKLEDEEINKLNPKKFGILVKSEDGLRSGLLLPNLEGVNTIEKQVSIACQKAGIDHYAENFCLYKFTVERYEEK